MNRNSQSFNSALLVAYGRLFSQQWSAWVAGILLAITNILLFAYEKSLEYCRRYAELGQLVFEFGWDSIKQTMASYYNESYPREAFGEFMDGFAIRFSALVQKDLAGFFEHWEYPMSPSAASKIRSFGHEEWLPPGW